MKKGRVKKVLAAVILILVLYVFAGAIAPFIRQPQITRETVEKVESTAFTGSGPSGERACVLTENGEALEERIRLISQAKDRIILSTFEFRVDESGKDVLAALIAAAQRGVSVQVLVDGFAGFTKMTGNPYFCALSGMENAQIKIYNPINPAKPWLLMGRLHDKYLIADETAYVLGGRNTYDYFLGAHDGYKNYDWDVLVYEKDPGPGESMKQLCSYFQGVWELPASHLYHDDEKILEKKSVKEAGRELQDRYTAMQRERPSWFEECDYIRKTKPVNHIELVSNPTTCYAKEPAVFYTITQLMQKAETEVRFHTPYILCNDWMLKRLETVCGSVPEVVMMTNSVANNGNPFGSMDYQKNRGKILKTGVRILEYDGGVSYHGKCFVIDDRLSGIGSFNWDMRSAYIDTELMLVIDSRELNAELRAAMGSYEQQALTVLDEENFIVPDGMTVLQITPKRRLRILLLGSLLGWARFLM